MSAGCCGGASLWSPTENVFRCMECGAVTSNDPNYLGYGITPNKDPWSYKSSTKNCTCGSEKTYGPNGTHTTWCDKGVK